MSVEWNTDDLILRVKNATGASIFNAVEDVRARAIAKIMSGDKTGRIYRRRGVDHQASAPGEAPANDTGRLVQSIQTEVDAATLTGTIKFQTAYAAALEFGTTNILPRPYARPSLLEAKADIEKNISDSIKRELK